MGDQGDDTIEEATRECAFAHSLTKKLSGGPVHRAFVDCREFGETKYDVRSTPYQFMVLDRAHGKSLNEILFNGQQGSADNVPELPTVTDVFAAVVQMRNMLDLMMLPTKENMLRHYHLDFQLQNIMADSAKHLSVIDYGHHLVCCEGHLSNCYFGVMSGKKRLDLVVEPCEDAMTDRGMPVTTVGQLYAVQHIVSDMLAMFTTAENVNSVLDSIQNVVRGEPASQEAKNMASLVRPSYRKDWVKAIPIVQVALQDVAGMLKSMGPDSSRDWKGKIFWPPRFVSLLEDAANPG